MEREGKPVALSLTPVWVNRAEIRIGTEKKQNTVSRRMNQLAEAGLIYKIDEGHGYYVVPEKGRKYLAGSPDASELEDKKLISALFIGCSSYPNPNIPIL